MTPAEELERIDAEIKALEGQRRAIYAASLEAPESEKVCEDFFARMLSRPSLFRKMEYPVSINGIHWDYRAFDPKELELVRIRPCAEEYGDKTFLGILIGDLPLSAAASLHNESGVLTFSSGQLNPAILVPALKKIVFGCESWWGVIKTEEDFARITDETIDKVPYVQMLKELVKNA